MSRLCFWLAFVVAGFLTFGCAALMETHMKKRWNRPYKKINLLLPLLAYAALWLRFGWSISAVKGVVLVLILLYASNSDLATHEVDDWLSVTLAVAALIGMGIEELPAMLCSGLMVMGIQLLVLLMRPQGYGGADVKITAALAMMMGLYRGLFVLCVGLTAMLIHAMARRKQKMEAIPCIPYFAASAMLAYLL